MHTLFGTGYTHGSSRVNVTNNIHVSVKNSSAEGNSVASRLIQLQVQTSLVFGSDYLNENSFGHLIFRTN